MLRTLSLIAAFSLLAACSGERLISDQVRPGVPDLFAEAARGGEIALSVTGRPFDGPRDALIDTVALAFAEGHNGPAATFTTTPGTKADRTYRVRVLFDPPPSLGTEAYCEAPGRGVPGAREGRLRMMAVFCRGPWLLTSVEASLPRPAAASDPALASLLRRTALLLFPLSDPWSSDTGCGILDC